MMPNLFLDHFIHNRFEHLIWLLELSIVHLDFETQPRHMFSKPAVFEHFPWLGYFLNDDVKMKFSEHLEMVNVFKTQVSDVKCWSIIGAWAPIWCGLSLVNDLIHRLSMVHGSCLIHQGQESGPPRAHARLLARGMSYEPWTLNHQ